MSLINFSGIASGIDSNSLIDAMMKARRQTQVVPHEEKITELTDTNEALNDLKAKINSLKTMLQKFSSLEGGALSKLASSSDETIATATASKSAVNGSYTVSVSQMARNANFSFNDQFASANDVINPNINNGDPNLTVRVEVGTGSNLEQVDIALTNTTKVSDFISQYNAVATKSVASLVNVGTTSNPAYVIMITTNEQGTDKGSISVSVGADITSTVPPRLHASTTQQALNAEFSVSGIGATITRSNNTISDLIPGLTMTLQATGSSTISVTDDADATKASIQEFVDMWNEIVNDIGEGNKITREEDGENISNTFGPLSGSRVDDNILSSLRAALSGANSSTGSIVRIFADIGIKTERDGTLAFDTDAFDKAIAAEPSSVNRLLVSFSDQLALSGGLIDQFTRFNGLFDISTQNNQTQITDLNRRIAEAEAQIARERENLIARYARLESLMGQLQNQQSALTSALAGLGN